MKPPLPSGSGVGITDYSIYSPGPRAGYPPSSIGHFETVEIGMMIRFKWVASSAESCTRIFGCMVVHQRAKPKKTDHSSRNLDSPRS